ncbi:MAG: hydroxyethylthiazole kinase [Akkermansia sp.]|nr:hydroxyethylthiazole kinase [Akkermansia sp.]
MKTPNQIAAEVLTTLRNKRPLILNLTNNVVQSITANMLLAVGGVPVMLTHSEEIRDLLHICANGMLVNVGTLNEQQAHTMKTAVRDAAKAGVPWVLDPVAVGLLKFRTEVCNELLSTPPAMIRGNASEIIALAGAQGALCRGVESAADSAAALPAAQALARKTGAAVLVTGETDYITDGARTITCTNGHEIMTRVTGVGCAMGALCAACVASADTAFDAAVATAAILGLAGERAAATCPHPGTFAAALLDELDKLTPQALQNDARLTEAP